LRVALLCLPIRIGRIADAASGRSVTQPVHRAAELHDRATSGGAATPTVARSEKGGWSVLRIGKQSKAPKDTHRAGTQVAQLPSAVADAQAVEGDLGDGAGPLDGRWSAG
jgi:hypothetical protein